MNNNVYGFSIYLSTPFAENVKLINQYQQAGFNFAFTSLHIGEESFTKNDVTKLLLTLAEQQIKVILDVSKRTLAMLNIDSLVELKAYGVEYLRVDYGYEIDELVSLAKHFQLVLNASIITAAELEQLLAQINKDQLIAMHNFYPRRNTGLSLAYFAGQNKLFYRHGIKVFAFISGKDKRGPIYEGVPTLEQHRDLSPAQQYLELSAMVDGVFVGDINIDFGRFNQLCNVDTPPGAVTLRCKLYNQSLSAYIDRLLTNRIDNSAQVIRVFESREYATKGASIPPHNCHERPIGCITMDNEHYQRYSGEVQICKQGLAANSRVNVIGQVIDEDLPLLHQATTRSFILKNIDD